MGRELKRKENKRNGKKVRDAVIINDDNPMNEVYKLLKVLGIVLGVLVLVYLLVGIFVTKEISFGGNKNNSSEVTMNADYLLASETFRQKEDKYYVYFYDFSDKNNDVESAITSKLSESRVYRVDIKSGFNSNFMSDTSNVKAQKKEELKINGVTLIVIENGKNVNYIEGSDNIITFINK